MTGTVVDNRVVTASSLNFGRFMDSLAQSGTSSLVTSGDDQHFTRITVAGQPFNSAS